MFWDDAFYFGTSLNGYCNAWLIVWPMFWTERRHTWLTASVVAAICNQAAEEVERLSPSRVLGKAGIREVWLKLTHKHAPTHARTHTHTAGAILIRFIANTKPDSFWYHVHTHTQSAQQSLIWRLISSKRHYNFWHHTHTHAHTCTHRTSATVSYGLLQAQSMTAFLTMYHRSFLSSADTSRKHTKFFIICRKVRIRPSHNLKKHQIFLIILERKRTKWNIKVHLLQRKI